MARVIVQANNCSAETTVHM